MFNVLSANNNNTSGIIKKNVQDESEFTANISVNILCVYDTFKIANAW